MKTRSALARHDAVGVAPHSEGAATMSDRGKGYVGNKGISSSRWKKKCSSWVIGTQIRNFLISGILLPPVSKCVLLDRSIEKLNSILWNEVNHEAQKARMNVVSVSGHLIQAFRASGSMLQQSPKSYVLFCYAMKWRLHNTRSQSKSRTNQTVESGPLNESTDPKEMQKKCSWTRLNGAQTYNATKMAATQRFQFNLQSQGQEQHNCQPHLQISAG
ncbi:unnamed protein product [Miscanthus lutarioriparius]|uniref:Uncharacterized protein n=1 Tax=Miscanthus lutarioriparius TaxID=422564 RepID=A0A811MXV5_9POAL|nr:unnamed protein product [Miscanthus lutarioriparius]